MLGSPGVVAQLTASPEGLSSMMLVGGLFYADISI
jgi:hypothetical protein